MTSAQKTWCDDWCRAHASSWQVLNRSQWQTVHAKTLVRFVEEVSLREEEITLLLEYLASDDCIATLQLYDQTIGAEWKPIRAWIELSNKSHGNIHAVRLYHGLRTDDGELEEMYFVEDGCAYKVWLTYHWNEPEPPPAVTPSESGISYAISSVSRDPDTGLYSWVEQKRERVQQDIEEYLSRKTIFADVYRESHIGVKAENLDTTGEGAFAGGGTKVAREVSKNADCTFDVHNQTQKDQPVSDSQVQLSKTLEGYVRSTTHVNQPEPLDVPKSEMRVGDSVSNEKTDSGLYNQRVVTTDETPIGVKGENCSRTIFEHSHGTVENVAERPTIDAPDAGGGVVTRQRASMTPHGTWDVHTDESVEKPVADATVTKSMTLHGLSVRKVCRNQSGPLPSPEKVGRSVTNTKTPGGLYDTVSEEPGSEPAGVISEGCRRTATQHTHSTVENKAEAEDPEHVFSVGEITDKTCGLNANGTADVRTTVTKVIPRKFEYAWHDANFNYLTVTYENWPSEPEVPEGWESASSIVRKNEFGLYDASFHCRSRTGWVSYAPLKTTGHVSQVVLKEYNTGNILTWHGGVTNKVRFYRRWEVKTHVEIATGAGSYDEMSAKQNIANTQYSTAIDNLKGRCPGFAEKFRPSEIRVDVKNEIASFRWYEFRLLDNTWMMETVR